MTLAEDQTNLCDASAVHLARRLREREVSAVEVLDAHVTRIEQVESDIGAFITLDLEKAREVAQTLDDRAGRGEFAGPLHGVPVAIKDIFQTADLRTTFGSKSFEQHVPERDALHVERIREAGGVILGKTNTPEFAFSGQTSNLVAGTTRNPHDVSRTVAGSSGGSAAALAAGMAALCDGSDLGGSLRAPAAWCGVVGFRPSGGLVPLAPSPTPFDGLHTPGPMARTVEDVALLLNIMARPSAAAPLKMSDLDFSAASRKSMPDDLRVAWCMTPGGATTDRHVIETLAPARRVLQSMGCDVRDDMPEISGLMEAHRVARNLCALQTEVYLASDPALYGPELKGILAAARKMTVDDVVRAQHVRTLAWERIVRFFETYHLMVWPSTSGLAYPADLGFQEITEDWRPVELTPLLDLPAISVPFGRTADGMPAGLQILGPKGADARVLQCAHAIQSQHKAELP